MSATLAFSMRALRTRLSLLAASWLCCQIAGLVAAPVVFGATAHTLAAGVSDVECDCPGTEPGQACPMHKSKAHQKSKADESACQLRSSCASADSALLSLSTGSVGVLTPLDRLEIEWFPRSMTVLVAAPIARAELPDAPPPRA
jgi:hypothetical protein